LADQMIRASRSVTANIAKVMVDSIIKKIYNFADRLAAHYSNYLTIFRWLMMKTILAKIITMNLILRLMKRLRFLTVI